MRQIFWYLIQSTIIGVVTVFSAWVIIPRMAEPVGLHVPVILGVILAVGATYAINDIAALWRRYRHWNRKF